MGTPVRLTTFSDLPPTLMTSLMCWELGPVCAMSFAYTGASAQTITMSRKRLPKNSASLLRRSRRRAIPSGPASCVLLVVPAASTGTTATSAIPRLYLRETVENSR